MSQSSEKIGAIDELDNGSIMRSNELTPGRDHSDKDKSKAFDAQADLVLANARIKELEEQVAIMTIKATSAGESGWLVLRLALTQLSRITDTSLSTTVDKLADYEDKLRRLSSGAALRALPTHPTTTAPERSILQSHRKSRSYLTVDLPDEPPRPATADGVVMPTPIQIQESRPSQFAKFPSFSNFWSGKKNVQQEERSGSPAPIPRQGEAQLILLDKSTASDTIDAVQPTNATTSVQPTSITFAEARPSSKRSVSTGTVSSVALSAASTSLAQDIATERNLRVVAEKKLVDLQAELEDLSTSLFEQANTMVADERRLRAKVEAKAVWLEARNREAQERLQELAGRWEEAGTMREERLMRLRILEERIGKVERVRRVVQGVG